MKNFLCFLPGMDEKDQKKVFFLFEYTHDGQLKSDQIGSTDRAVGTIQAALTESTRNIAIDTSTCSGRNLLNRIMPLAEKHPGRTFLASLFRQERYRIEEYWHQWGSLAAEERLSTDTYLVVLFKTARTVGGHRPLTSLDKLTLQTWNAKGVEDVPAELLNRHPAAQYLRVIVQTMMKKSDTTVFDPLIIGMTYQMCRLVQDPFPLEDTEKLYRPPHFRFFADLFLPEKKDTSFTTPENIVFDVIDGKAPDRNILKKYNPPLWSLIVAARRFFDSLLGTRSGNRLDVSGTFRKNCLFEKRLLLLFDRMLCVWTEALVPSHSSGGLNFVDHELFSERFAGTILDRCKEFLKNSGY